MYEIEELLGEIDRLKKAGQELADFWVNEMKYSGHRSGISRAISKWNAAMKGEYYD